MVTIYTTRSIIMKFYFLHTHRLFRLCVLCEIQKKIALISQQCISEAVFLTDTTGVYHAVRTESLNMIQYNCLFKGLTLEQYILLWQIEDWNFSGYN
jgi:hypothetical protein